MSKKVLIMKPGTKITMKRRPRDNGRPQLWYAFANGELCRIRILYPDGVCEFAYADTEIKRSFEKSCFMMRWDAKSAKLVRDTFSMRSIQKNALTYLSGFLEHRFGGYL